MDIPECHVGSVLLSETGRTVWWTGRLAIGLRYEAPRGADATSQSAQWVHDVMLPALRVPGRGLDRVGADLGQYTMRCAIARASRAPMIARTSSSSDCVSFGRSHSTTRCVEGSSDAASRLTSSSGILGGRADGALYLWRNRRTASASWSAVRCKSHLK
jgi:hypothetical protein